jgi:hypothetical protein
MPSALRPRLLLATLAAVAVATAVIWRATDIGFFARPAPVFGETTVALRIGDDAINPPANMLRFADQRYPGSYPRIELILTWPALRAPDQDDPALKTTARDGRLVFLTIEPRETELDTADRIGTIYQKFLSQDQGADPDARLANGLVRRKFLAGTAYDGEELYFEPGSVHPFAARCFPLAKGEAPASCLREVRLAKHLAVTMRFPVGALEDWRLFSDRMDSLLSDMTGGSSG